MTMVFRILVAGYHSAPRPEVAGLRLGTGLLPRIARILVCLREILCRTVNCTALADALQTQSEPSWCGFGQVDDLDDHVPAASSAYFLVTSGLCNTQNKQKDGDPANAAFKSQPHAK